MQSYISTSTAALLTGEAPQRIREKIAGGVYETRKQSGGRGGNGGESLEQTHFNHIINGDFIQQKRIREEKTRQEVREATAQRGTQSQQGRQHNLRRPPVSFS